MGMIDSKLQPLHSYRAVSTLHSFIGGMRFLGQAGACHTNPCIVMPDDFALRFRNASHLLVVAWTVDGFRHSAGLKFARGCWDTFTWLGKPAGRGCPHGNLDSRLTLGQTVPQRYINVYLEDAPTYLVQRVA